jgi:hypothetical protein
VIGLAIDLGDSRFHLVIRHTRDGLVRDLCNSHVGGRRCHQNVALRPRFTLTLIDGRLVSDVKGLVSFTSQCMGSGSSATSSKWRSKRLEGESEKRWDLTWAVALSFIRVAGDSVMIHFPRKKYISISTTYAICAWDREAKKFGSLKYFEACGVDEKEPWFNG